MTKHNLDIDEVPDSLIAEMGLTGIAATAKSFRCSDPAAFYVRVSDVIALRSRRLELKMVTSIMQGVRDGADIEPITVFREPGESQATLLDGTHRFRVSLKLGFVEIPCTQPARHIAEDVYRYPRR